MVSVGFLSRTGGRNRHTNMGRAMPNPQLRRRMGLKEPSKGGIARKSFPTWGGVDAVNLGSCVPLNAVIPKGSQGGGMVPTA
jgi:hypothetical protein